MSNFNDGNNNSAHYYSGLSGDVILINSKREEFSIDGKFLLDFIANYVASRRISALEQATTKEILGI